MMRHGDTRGIGRYHALSLVLAVLGAGRADAQSRVPDLPVVRDLVIDASANDLSPVSWIAAARNGTIAIGQAQDHLVRFFDEKGKSLGVLGRDGEGPGEFRRIDRGGWIADTLWVTDRSQPRFTLISPDLKLLRTVPMATGMRTSERDSNQSVQVISSLGLYANGDQLKMGIIPALDDPQLPSWARTKANTGSRIALGRVSSAGILLRPVAYTPFDQCGMDMSALAKLCQRPLAEIGPNSDRVATATAATSGTDMGTFRVVVIDQVGDTIFARRFPFKPEQIDAHLRDSLTALAAAGPRPTQIRGLASERPAPKIYPPLIHLVIGRDGTTWVEMRTTTAGRPYLVLDPKGNPIGMVTLPPNTTIGAASRNTIWATQRDADDVESVVRFRVGT